MKKWMAVFFLLLLAADILSKIAASHSIPTMAFSDRWFPYGGIGIFSDFYGISFSLNTTFNTGAAWGIFAGHSGLLFGIRAAIIFGLILYLVIFQSAKMPKFPLWLIVTGAVGNALDYLRYGHVVDFFHFVFWGYSFPIFNLADAYITIGVAILFLVSRFSKKQLQPS